MRNMNDFRNDWRRFVVEQKKRLEVIDDKIGEFYWDDKKVEMLREERYSIRASISVDAQKRFVKMAEEHIRMVEEKDKLVG